MGNDEIKLKLTLDDREVEGVLKALPSGFSKSGSKAGKEFSGSFRSIFAGSFFGNIAADITRQFVSSVKSAFSSLAVGSIEASKSLEVIETQFKTLLGSTQAAKKQLSDLQNFAASTPFQIEGLSLATRQLLSFGVEQENVIDKLSQLGDIASGVGASIDELTIPYGRIISQQKLTLVELDKFSDRGVNIYKELAKEAGLSLGEVRDAVSKGSISVEAFEKALNNLTGASGSFFKGMEKQSKTLAGQLSTLGDNFFNLQGAIGNLIKPILIKGVQRLTSLFQELSKQINEIKLSDLTRQVQIFGTYLIDYVISPFEIGIKAMSLFFSVMKTGFQTMLTAITAPLGLIAELAESLGVESGITKALIQFKDTSLSVLDDFVTESGEKFDSLMNGDVVASSLQQKFSKFTSTISAMSEAVGEKVKETNDKMIEKTETAFDRFISSANAAWDSFEKNAKSALGGAITKAFSSFGRALATGENALESFVNSFLASIGEMAIQLGSFFILQGTGRALSGDPTGAALIGIGAALAALGGALTSVFSNKGGGSDATGGVIASPVTDVTRLEQTERLEQGQGITINVQGDYFDSDDANIRLVDRINDAFRKTGARLDGAI